MVLQDCSDCSSPSVLFRDFQIRHVGDAKQHQRDGDGAKHRQDARALAPLHCCRRWRSREQKEGRVAEDFSPLRFELGRREATGVSLCGKALDVVGGAHRSSIA